MPTYFFDANPLVYRYSNSNLLASRWVEAVTRKLKPLPSLVISTLTFAEVTSALCGIHRGGGMSQRALSNALRTFDRNKRNLFSVVDVVSPTDFENASALVEKYAGGQPAAIAANDALQLVSARRAYDSLTVGERRDFFIVTSDAQMLRIAQAEGFAVLNPLVDSIP